MLALIMLVNALSFGTIIPLLYPYATRFGLDAMGLSWLFASFSLFQFLATPIIGRLSDRFGRKPLLLLSIFGTSVSLALFASAQSATMLFVARILDGITGGNMSVAQAVVADTTTGKERAKAFGMLGASFGFGFLFGPAVGGLLSTFGLTVPFWFASGLALLATILGWVFLEESLDPQNQNVQKHEPLFNFSALAGALFHPLVGKVLLVSLIAALASNAFILGFQAYTVDVLELSAQQIGILFTLAGAMSVIAQVWGVSFVIARFGTKERALLWLIFASGISLVIMALGLSFYWFVAIIFFYTLVSPLIGTMITSLLSEKVQSEDQGVMLGISQSYASIGQIVGPLLAGVIASFSVSAVFAAAAVLMLLGMSIARGLRPLAVKLNV